MSEMTNIMNTGATAAAGLHAGNTEGTGEYYRAYYRELLTRGASRSARNRRLEEIKTERRRVRRERWLKGLKSLASSLISSEAVS